LSSAASWPELSVWFGFGFGLVLGLVLGLDLWCYSVLSTQNLRHKSQKPHTSNTKIETPHSKIINRERTREVFDQIRAALVAAH
jgi:hypothetical protein